MEALEQSDDTKLAVRSNLNGTFSLAPRNFEEAWRMAQIIAASDMVPKDYKGNPGNCLIAMEMGSELGLKPIQSLQNIAVINGRPAVWGDAMLAVLQGSPLWDASAFEESMEGTAYQDDYAAVCKMRRKGGKLRSVRFSVADAKLAGLWGKQGPWKQYPARMLQMRARAFAARDTFSDLLRGIHVAEEVQDIEDTTYSDVSEVAIEPKTRTETVKQKLEQKVAKEGNTLTRDIMEAAERVYGKDKNKRLQELAETATKGRALLVGDLKQAEAQFILDGILAKEKPESDEPDFLKEPEE